MKKVLLLMLVLVSMTAKAQKDVTKFLGIPVDGTKTAMIQKLKEKGFKYNQTLDQLTGEFNGRNVILSVVTNNNKVWRILVKDASPSSETDIKIRFNNLCQQFEKNGKYMSASTSSYIISESEDISYEMTVHNKRYEAAYFQALDAEQTDTISAQTKVKNALLKKYTQDQLDNPTEEQRSDMQNIITNETLKIAFDLLEKKSVWFMINEQYGEYRILLFYDNEYNHADGEDL